ncbi:MAG TPA: hypothetical protein VNF69_15545 [Burkholderiales bacterium]|nr:hypothetical protein [Burkholderiales bacterium]
MASKVVSISQSQSVSATPGTQDAGAAPGFSLVEVKDPTLRAEIEYHVGCIRQSIHRTAWEIVEMGRSLHIIQQRLGWPTFDRVCADLCGMDPRVARRMIATAKFADERLGEHKGVLENLSAVVVYRLAQGNLADAVIEQVIQQAADGKKVMPADIQAAIDRLEKEVDAKDTRNEQLESDNAALRKDAEREASQRQGAQLLVLQLKDIINRHDEALERASSERIALVDERRKLKQEIERLTANPVEKEVPTLPPEFASLQEALKAKEKRLREISNELQKAETRVDEAKRQMAALEGQRASAKATLEDLASLEAEVQALLAKYSAAYVASAAAADSKAAAKFERVASLLHKLAAQMERAAAHTPARRR